MFNIWSNLDMIFTIVYVTYTVIKVSVNKIKEEKEWRAKLRDAEECVKNLKWEG